MQQCAAALVHHADIDRLAGGKALDAQVRPESAWLVNGAVEHRERDLPAKRPGDHAVCLDQLNGVRLLQVNGCDLQRAVGEITAVGGLALCACAGAQAQILQKQICMFSLQRGGHSREMRQPVVWKDPHHIHGAPTHGKRAFCGVQI